MAVRCALFLSCLLLVETGTGHARVAPDDSFAGYRQIGVEAVNAAIATARLGHECWTESPFTIVTKLFGPAAYSEGSSRYVIDWRQNKPDMASAVVIMDGLADDSISGEKRLVRLAVLNGEWRIVEIRLGVKCQTGRGGGQYSGKPCL